MNCYNYVKDTSVLLYIVLCQSANNNNKNIFSSLPTKTFSCICYITIKVLKSGSHSSVTSEFKDLFKDFSGPFYNY